MLCVDDGAAALSFMKYAIIICTVQCLGTIVEK